MKKQVLLFFLIIPFTLFAQSDWKNISTVEQACPGRSSIVDNTAGERAGKTGDTGLVQRKI